MFQIRVSFLWFLNTANALVVIYVNYPFVASVTEPVEPTAVLVIYMATARLLWAASVAWVITACVSGYGGELY